MLIEFKVANFRSIREEQRFSLVASNSDKNLPQCVITPNLPGLAGVNLLKGAAIYGANASGKSNVLEAMGFLEQFVLRSATKLQPGDPTGIVPFKLDSKSALDPSDFEITFVAEGTRYVFGMSLTEQRVVEEYLIAYPKGTPQRWYHRKFNKKAKTYEWAKPSSAFKHDKSLVGKTRDNCLFLSVGPQFNHAQLLPVFNWFKANMRFLRLSADSVLTPGFTAELITQAAHHDRILNLLRSADVGVDDALIKEEAVTLDELKKNLPPSIMANLEAGGKLSTIKSVEINLSHKAEGCGSVPLDFDNEESVGTRRFFALVGPWTDILANGRTLFVDEIETSLHPNLVRELLRLVFSSKDNPNGAQVVFTTHNPILLDASLMRRDQIWFTEKTAAGTTHLYPLTDYRPRQDEALPKGYLAGRYGAIPYLPEGLKL